MRYLHHNADGILEYLKANDFLVWKFGYDGSPQPATAAPFEIRDLFERSETLWGLRLPYYLVVSKADSISMLPLRAAVPDVELANNDETFLLVAYQDGGVISVSGAILPFQTEADAAGWWRP